MNFEEHILVGISVRHGDFDPAYRIDSPRANFQKLDPDCPWHSFGQRRVLQSFAPDAVDQDISVTGHDETKLIGAVVMGAHAVAEQIKLTILDAVFHIASGAVYIFIDFFWCGGLSV